MGVEIERKFLVINDDWRSKSIKTKRIVQFYLSNDPARTVRVRVSDKFAYITVKGLKVGASCPEFEYPIPVSDALAMQSLSVGSIIRKDRHIVFDGDKPRLAWEVDEFLEQHSGLVVAEIELPSEDFSLCLPKWVGKEVTTDPSYSNARLSMT